MGKILWFSLGSAALLLGAIGIFLPLLPTVPFLLVTAFCYARASGRLHDWLMEHPTLGPPILDWQEKGAIGRKAKVLATASVAAAFGMSLWLGVATYALILQAVVLACVMAFIWTRPAR